MNYAPIVLFVYNRPEHTNRVYSMLKTNKEAMESELYVVSDGAKNEADQGGVTQVRRMIRKFEGFKNIYIIEREENWGIEKSEYEAISKVVNQCGKIIVLEDDLLINQGFLNYMNKALVKYEKSSKVFSISAYAYIEQKTSQHVESFFLQMPTSWGWGTWKDKWNKMQMNPKDINILHGSREAQRKFDCHGAYPWYKMLCQLEKITGEITWDLCWHWTIVKNDGLVLYPQYSLVINDGFDGSGVHCPNENRNERLKLEEIKIDVFPNEERIDENMSHKIARKMRRKNVLLWVKYKLKVIKEML